MAHCFHPNSNNPFSWAGQAADDPFGQKWLPNSEQSAQPAGRAGLLSTDAPRNDESLIKDFNDELPDHDAQGDALGQSSWLLVNGALSDHTDLPFDLAIDNDIGLDAARPVSYEIARTSSQASSTGIDEESIGFSNADDPYDDGFSASYGDAILNGINSPGTSFSDVNLSTNPSLESSPVSPRCPFLSMQAGNSGPGISSRNATSAPQSYITNANSSFPEFGSARAPRSVPTHNISALSTELASQTQYQASGSSPSSEYFERWSSRAGDDAMESVDVAMWDDSSFSESFVPYMQNQLGPSFVIVPPETPDMTMRDLNDFTASEMYRSSETHPIDYYLSANYAAAQLTEPRSHGNSTSLCNEHNESPLGPYPPTSSSDVRPGPYEYSLESPCIGFSAPAHNERRGLYIASGKSCSERQGPVLLASREHSLSAGASGRASEKFRGHASHAYCLSA
ncbi:LOW QUALITY PROTEIN: zn(II)2Cys6 transcription factor [Colletotrichum tofieldiae]|nr:LOW QUALITY PROTEIN: zn(II)2Cys6 transcription factor [Colletotrichum tofieldiae]GKT89350.1 LOW QUALITY PROTEIN: Zn(II)2Cys6 transcription factor [Colletotrichum tofieldiae]